MHADLAMKSRSELRVSRSSTYLATRWAMQEAKNTYNSQSFAGEAVGADTTSKPGSILGRNSVMIL